MIFSEQIRFASLWDIWFEWSPYNSINVFKIHIYKCIYLLSRCFGGIKFEWAFWWSSLWNHIRWYCLNYEKKTKPTESDSNNKQLMFVITFWNETMTLWQFRSMFFSACISSKHSLPNTIFTCFVFRFSFKELLHLCVFTRDIEAQLISNEFRHKMWTEIVNGTLVKTL